MSKMSFIVEFEDGQEPAISAATDILGGKLISFAFYDIRPSCECADNETPRLAESERHQAAVLATQLDIATERSNKNFERAIKAESEIAVLKESLAAGAMNKLISVGECLIDVHQVVSVEPYPHGYHSQNRGAKITFITGDIAYEKESTLREVKDKINAVLSDEGGL